MTGGNNLLIKKLISCFSAIAVLTIGTSLYSASVSATTVDDVAAVARSYGYSEDDISAGYNAYYANPSKYPSEVLDQAIAYLHSAGAQTISTSPQAEPEPAQTTPTSPDVQTPRAEEQPAIENGIDLTASDGTAFTRISREKFINMSYDEKMSYVHSFPQSQQQAIIDDLSPEEYKSIMKQSPTDKKMQIIGKLSEAANEMGLNITVDEITDSSLTVAMRNDEGELVNISTAGATVDDTGYDRRGIFALSAALLCAAACMTIFLLRIMKKYRSEN